MELFELLKKSGLNTKEISKRLHLGVRTVQNYANGSQTIPEYIKKLIRYEFAESLPKEERLVSEPGEVYEKKTPDFSQLKEENRQLQRRVQELEQDKEDLKGDKKMLELHIKTLTSKNEGRQETA
jgi:transcriptional regulator with XRE-family HTH domain